MEVKSIKYLKELVIFEDFNNTSDEQIVNN